MDKVKDFFSQLNERFSNPLVFSFLFSWLIINWKISIALIWYDTTQINQYGFDSIYQLIEKSINIKHSLVYPFFSALCYVLVMPIVKNLIKVFYTMVAKWGEIWSLKVAKNGQISIEKYFRIKDNYEKRSRKLEEIITNESLHISEHEDLNTKYLELKAVYNDLAVENNAKEKLINLWNDKKILDGIWICTYKFDSGREGNEDVVIKDGSYYIQSKFGKKEHRFEIQDFSYNPITKVMFFIKKITDEFKDKVTSFDYQHISRLEVIDNDLITGYEDDTTIIEYRRKK